MNTLMLPNYYKVLGLDPKATDIEIKTNYHKLARLYHPDIHNGNRYHNLFVAINQAYTVLRDENSRKAYDFQLREQEQANQPNVIYGGTSKSSDTVKNIKQNASKNSGPIYYSKSELNAHIQSAKKAYNEKSFVKAMKEADIAISINPNSFMAHELKGDILSVYANYAEAQKEYEEALKFNKNNTGLSEKINICIEKTKPKKKNFLSRLKNKLFEETE